MSYRRSSEELQRIQQLEELKQLGINPYPSLFYPVTHAAEEIKSGFQKHPEAYESVSVAGRIMVKRVMGNASFAVLQDGTGTIQLYFSRDILAEKKGDPFFYNTLFKKYILRGDIVGVRGKVFQTRTGEITIEVHDFTLLAKAIRPLPMPKQKDDKVWDAFTDPEQRYRMRYVDLIVNPHVRQLFRKRSQIIQVIRDYLLDQGYLEVETPILQPIYGGANARPFVTYHNALKMRLFLRIANELYLKRLIVGGFDGVFEFAKDFRNEGLSRFHNPEFTQLELYVAYKDYRWMMDFVESLLESVVLQVSGDTKVYYDSYVIDFKRPWKRISFYEALNEAAGCNVRALTEQELKVLAAEHGIQGTESMSKAGLLDALFGTLVEPHCVNPTIIYDYPVEMSPLAKRKASDPEITERFEVICNRKELANAFSELNDPFDQRKRFEEQLRLRERGDEEAMVMDEDFLRALEFGMPPTAGIGIGIDRLVMILTGAPSIQEVILFPHLKPESHSLELAQDLKALVPETYHEALKSLFILTLEDLLAIESTVLFEKLSHHVGEEGPRLEEVKEWQERAKAFLGQKIKEKQQL